MTALIDIGIIVSAPAIRWELLQRINNRGLEYPAMFTEFIEASFDDYPDRQALILPAGTRIAGDLLIDWHDEFRQHNLMAVAAWGDLFVEGTVRNENLNSGPLFFVGGDLQTRHIDKGGAHFIILGNVQVESLILCEYNDGALRVGGDLKAAALLSLGQDVYVAGSISGTWLSWEEDNLPETLVPEVFNFAANPDEMLPDGSLIRQRLTAGLPVLRNG